MKYVSEGERQRKRQREIKIERDTEKETKREIQRKKKRNKETCKETNKKKKKKIPPTTTPFKLSSSIRVRLTLLTFGWMVLLRKANILRSIRMERQLKRFGDCITRTRGLVRSRGSLSCDNSQLLKINFFEHFQDLKMFKEKLISQKTKETFQNQIKENILGIFLR
jgi:hypothetical protein